MKVNKDDLILHLKHVVDERIAQARAAFEGVQQAINNETKSTAGDKHDTSRELLQQEKNKIAQNLANLISLKKVFHQFEVSKLSNKISLGSLFLTNAGLFFIGIPLGEIEWESKSVVCLSPVSPLGKIFMNKTVGDTVVFNRVKYFVKTILD